MVPLHSHDQSSQPASAEHDANQGAAEHETLSGGDRRTLLEIASKSISHGLREGCALPVEPGDYGPRLQQPGASFVTLRRHTKLRGCIGSLTATRPLCRDVAENAFAAAFRDPRFPPLRLDEASDIDLHVSVLTQPKPITFTDEADALGQIRPGIDGVVLEDPNLLPHAGRGTFLPAVWETLNDPNDFWRELKRKANLPPNHWSDSMRVLVYQAIEIENH